MLLNTLGNFQELLHEQERRRPQKQALLGSFSPWLYAIGSKIRQVRLREMALDANVMASGVIDSGKLFNPPAVCVNFDTTIWAEAVGCTVNRDDDPPKVESGGSTDANPDLVREAEQITTLKKAISRIQGALTNHQIVCAIPGPATLASSLGISPPASKMDQFIVGELLTEFVNVLCESEIDNILVLEGSDRDDEDLQPWIEGNHYSRIAKLAEHYVVETTLLCPRATLTDMQIQAFDGFTYVAANPYSTISASFENAAKAISVGGFGTGNAIIPDGVEALEPGSYLLTTEWDLDPSHDFTDIQKDIATIKTFLEEVSG